MAQGRGVTKAKLKRDLDQIGRDLLNINLQIQHLKQQGNIATLQQAKLQVQKEVVTKDKRSGRTVKIHTSNLNARLFARTSVDVDNCFLTYLGFLPKANQPTIWKV